MLHAHKVGDPIKCMKPSEAVYHWTDGRNPVVKDNCNFGNCHPWRVLIIDDSTGSRAMNMHRSLRQTGLVTIEKHTKTETHRGVWVPDRRCKAFGYREIDVTVQGLDATIQALFSERNKQRRQILAGHCVSLGSDDAEFARQMQRFDEAMAKHTKG